MPFPANNGNDNESNLFVAFKRRVDSAFDSWRGPDSFYSMMDELQAAFKKMDESYERAMNPERRQLEGRDELLQPPARTRDGTVSFSSRPESAPERYGRLQTQHPWFSHQFLMESMYSPRYLEFEDDESRIRPEKRMHWRGAFCDLLATVADMDDEWRRGIMLPMMSGENPEPNLRFKHGEDVGVMFNPEEVYGDRSRRMIFPFPPRDPPDVSWIQRGRERGYDMERSYRFAQFLDDKMSEAAAETELDLYEHVASPSHRYEDWLRSIGEGKNALPPRASAEAANALTSQFNPSLVATLTTVQSVTRPDGSVETRRVLKRRFADGNEEVNDHTEVTSAPEKYDWRKLQKRDQCVMEELGKMDGPAIAEKRKEGGWFWSSP